MAEALAGETGLKVDSVTLADSGGTARLTVAATVEGTQLTAKVTLQ